MSFTLLKALEAATSALTTSLDSTNAVHAQYTEAMQALADHSQTANEYVEEVDKIRKEVRLS